MSLFGSAGDEALPRQAPLKIADETYVLRAATPSSNGATCLNSMLIRAAEPIVIDTGMVTDRENWFDDLFSLVEPEDVRWIFVTHNDSDHSGNLVEALERCPNAKVMASRAESFRTVASFGVPIDRIRMIDNGDSFTIGNRTLSAIRPPVYDSPYTRGLFDTSTGVYYASDAFCTPMPDGPVDHVSEIAADAWEDGMIQFHHNSLCPWISLVDQERFAAEVGELAKLGIKTIASAHSPVIDGPLVGEALDQMARLPGTTPRPLEIPDFHNS